MKPRICLSFVLIVCFALTARTLAEDTTFTAASSSDWNDAMNWDTGALPTVGDNIFIGSGTSSGGAFPGPVTATLSSQPTNQFIDDIRVGHEVGGVGTFDHSGGALTTSADKWIFVGVDGRDAGAANGTYNISGTASLTQSTLDAEEFYIGAFGDAGQSTGLMTIADQASVTANRLYIGDGSAANGTLTQTGGSLVAEDWLVVGRGGEANGTYNMSGGTLAVNTDYLTIGENADGTMQVSGDAEIDANALGVGRFGSGAVGMLSISGDQARIETFQLQVGRNDQDLDENGNLNPADATGTLHFESSTANVTPISVIGDVYLNDGSVIGSALLDVALTGPTTGDVLLVDVLGVVDGTFAGLPEGAFVPNSGGRSITYVGGNGNDIVLLEGSGMNDGDFNNDGDWNCTDIDALVAAIAGGSTDLSFDMNGDGSITAADITDAGVGWLSVGGAQNPTETGGNPFLVGDANLSGSVDVSDFNVWNGNKFTNVAAWCAGDFTADGSADVSDFNAWNGNKFTSSMDGAVVPEPAAGLLLLALIPLFRRRRK